MYFLKKSVIEAKVKRDQKKKVNKKNTDCKSFPDCNSPLALTFN